MDLSVSEEFLNDNSKLESKVIRALYRLQKKTAYSGKLTKQAGISVRQIVKYLKANYCGLDGDIEAQVITVLLQCIRNGLICALDNGRYLLLGPKTKTMISSCFSRTVHGPRCSCSKKVTCTNACCTVNVNIEKQGALRRRKLKKNNVNSESENVQTILCNCCCEIHPTNEKSKKRRPKPPVRGGFNAPFDIFSPRDETNYNVCRAKRNK